MQLKIRRGQRSGMMGGKIIFTLDIVAGLDAEESALVKRYNLGNEVVYSSEASNVNAERAQGGSLAGLGALVADKLTKRFITVKQLLAGEHMECKDVAELLANEAQIREACANLKKYLEVAQTFDGREDLVDIGKAA